MTITIDNGNKPSRNRGMSFSSNLLDSIKENARKANLPFGTALGLVAKESSMGNGVDQFGTSRGINQSLLP